MAILSPSFDGRDEARPAGKCSEMTRLPETKPATSEQDNGIAFSNTPTVG